MKKWIKNGLRTPIFIWKHPLAGRQKFRAMQRWLMWQLISKSKSDPITVPWIEKSVFKMKRGMTGATGNLYCGLHEFHDMALLLHFFSTVHGLFLDIGANIGSYTILASKVGKAKSIAVEPVGSTVMSLKENITANCIDEKVEVLQVAIGEKPGKGWFSIDQDTTNQVVDMAYQGRKEVIEVRTIDQILGARRAEFWKIDVEGYEDAALAGASISLENPEVQIILLEGDNFKIRSIMKSKNFKRAKYDPFTKTVIEINTEEPVSGSNNLWVRNADKITARCKKSPPINVYGQVI